LFRVESKHFNAPIASPIYNMQLQMTEKLLQAEKGYARLAQADPAQQQVPLKEGFSAAYAPIILPSQIQSETGAFLVSCFFFALFWFGKIFVSKI